eukprot:8987532-Heterocapsa_arctica.AAC.1
MGILHEPSRPGVPQSNAVIERSDILEGTRTSMIHAGFPEYFWSFAAPHYCFNDKLTALISMVIPLRTAARGSEPK